MNCLQSLARQQTNPEWLLEICVVENDSIPRSKTVVEDAANAFSLPIRYYLEPQRGIPFARNRTLKEALNHHYDWIALIDDDEVAKDNWLIAHMNSLQTHNASVSYGAVTKHYEESPPSWWYSDVPNPNPAGHILSRASTNNVVFTADLIRAPASLQFNPIFLYGYEDLDFFENAHAKGFKIVWTPDAVVAEEVAASRVQPARLLDWARSSAAAHVQVSILRKGYVRSALKFSFKSLRRIISGGVGTALFFLPATLGNGLANTLYYRCRMRLSRGIGNLQGVFRAQHKYYDAIDGR